MYLYPSVFRYFGGMKDKFEVCTSNNGGKSFAAAKAGSRPAHGKQDLSHFAIRYVVVQCCHYQRSVAAVLENVVFCSEWLLYVSDWKYPVTGITPCYHTIDCYIQSLFKKTLVIIINSALLSAVM